MARATFLQHSFLGGEFSAFAQGRVDRADYHIGMNVCFNAFPVEIGPWTRRPGTRMAGTTKGGLRGRVVKFDFQQAASYSLEFTDSTLRFRSGYTIVTTNDTQTVVAISAANPAVVQTTTPHGWLTGNTVMFDNLLTTCAILQARQLTITVIDATHFSLQDSLSPTNIDGSTLSAVAAGATVSRVHELTTPYPTLSWQSVRAVQAEKTSILLQGSTAPQALGVTPPAADTNAVFALNPAVFQDGPYLDPFTNGVQATPGAVSGVVGLTLSFATWSNTTAYAKGSFVTRSGNNYVSIVDQNVGHDPAATSGFWQTTSAGAAIGPNGFQGSDVGRLVRLFSEPALWLAGTTYASGTIVAFNPSGIPGAATYWASLVGSNTGQVPGADTTHWQLVPSQGVANWTWGKITALTNTIDRALAGSTAIGDMTDKGGINAVFDGNFAQDVFASAGGSVFGGFLAPGSPVALLNYVGKHYGAGPQVITHATVYAPSSGGYGIGSFYQQGTGVAYGFIINFTLNLYAKQTAPTRSGDGTLLGTTGVLPNTGQAMTIVSSDQVTAWNYVWVEVIITSQTYPGITSQNFNLFSAIGQVSFFGPPGTGTGAGVSVEILGAPLLNTFPIVTWRLGAYSNTTGWPTCGAYHEGRLWLGGAIDNRFDASVSNGISGATINFAPTDLYGAVNSNNAISYTLNSNSVNPMFWMEPTLEGVAIGTQAGEYLVRAATSGPITAQNIAATSVTKIGCANVEPRRAEHTIVFVQRYAKKLIEYFADLFSGKLSGPNLADKAQHVTRAGIAELAYQNAATPIMWGRDNDGALFGCTYKRDTLSASQPPAFNAFHRHALGSARQVISISGGPSVGGDLDTLTMVTTDPNTQQGWVELLTDAMDEDAALTDMWFLDGAVVPTSYTVSDAAVLGAALGGITLNGLWHLNGQTVNVFAGGLDCGTTTVANGSAFVSFGDSISGGTASGLFTHAFVNSFAAGIKIVVGFAYTSQGQLLRSLAPQDSGSRLGPSLGLYRRLHRYSFLVDNTRDIKVGTRFDKLLDVKLQFDGGKAYSPTQMYSGVVQDALNDDNTYDGMLCWQVSSPLPCTVVAASANLDTKDQ